MNAFPMWLQAGCWGALAGAALLIGAVIGYLADVPQRLIAAVMAFGAGVLISVVAFDLMEEAYRRGGFDSASGGFLAGGLLYTGANWYLARQGAKHRKRSGHQQQAEAQSGGTGLAIAVGALIDGTPESIAIGVSMIQGGIVSLVTVIAIFLSNIPEGLSSSAGMKKAGRSAIYIFGVWGAIALLSGLASLSGYTLFRNVSPEIIAATIAIAAGGILTMLADTMMPEVFEHSHNLAGLITLAGFLCAFLLTKLQP